LLNSSEKAKKKPTASYKIFVVCKTVNLLLYTVITAVPLFCSLFLVHGGGGGGPKLFFQQPNISGWTAQESCRDLARCLQPGFRQRWWGGGDEDVDS
jgi:hypothetical protein